MGVTVSGGNTGSKTLILSSLSITQCTNVSKLVSGGNTGSETLILPSLSITQCTTVS